MTMKEGDYDTARASFEEALKIDTTMKDAALNISTTYIEEGNVLLDEMNKLLEVGTDAAYNKYDELKAQKSSLYEKGFCIPDVPKTIVPFSLMASMVF